MIFMLGMMIKFSSPKVRSGRSLAIAGDMESSPYPNIKYVSDRIVKIENYYSFRLNFLEIILIN